LPRSFQVERRLAPHLVYVDRAARRLARGLFHAMARHQAGLEKKQALLARFVDIGTELFATAASCARADVLHGLDPQKHAGVVELADLFARGARQRIEESFRRTRRNHDPAGYRLAQKVTAGEYQWLEEGGADIAFK
jgi:hypothetical protein